MRLFATVCLVIMANVLETIFESAGNDTYQVTTYQFSTFNSSETGFGGLTVLYNVWNALRGDAIAPDSTQFTARRLAIMDSQLTTTFIDVSDPNPWRYKIVHEHSLSRSNPEHRLPNGYLKDIACPMRSRVLIRTCMEIRETRQPAYHEISTRIRGDGAQFMQLSLPLETSA